MKGEDTSLRHLLELVTHREREQRKTSAQGDLSKGEGLSLRDQLSPKEREATTATVVGSGRTY